MGRLSRPNDPFEIDDHTIEVMGDRALGPDPDLDRDPLDISGINPEPASVRISKAEFAQSMDDRARGAGLTAVPDLAEVLSARRKQKFLVALAQTGVVGTSAARAGLSVRTLKSIRKTDREFAELWDDAIDFAADVAENEAFHRGVHGEVEPVFFKGAQVGEVIRKSDRMLELVLKARRPEKFRENFKVETSVSGGVLVIPAATSQDSWEVEAAKEQAKHRTGNTGTAPQ